MTRKKIKYNVLMIYFHIEIYCFLFINLYRRTWMHICNSKNTTLKIPENGFILDLVVLQTLNLAVEEFPFVAMHSELQQLSPLFYLGLVLLVDIQYCLLIPEKTEEHS